MVTLLVIVGVLSLAVGAVFTSQATAGACAVGAACFWAILARIAQADQHQRELKAVSAAREDARPPAAKAVVADGIVLSE